MQPGSLSPKPRTVTELAFAGADGANKRVNAVIDKIHFRTLILHLSNIAN